MSRYAKYKDTYQAYYQANKEHIAELRQLWRDENPNYDRAYYLANRERILERLRKYREENKELVRKQKKLYRKRNRQKLMLKKKEYRQNHPEEIRAQNVITDGTRRGKNDFPLAPCCELCPDDEKRTENLEHAHLDYDFPTLYVTACPSCHAYADGRTFQK